MSVLVGFRAFHPTSSFVSWDTDVATHSGTLHTRRSLANGIKTKQHEIFSNRC
jgi:hypothetical protein